jgi:hypothetical protein
MRSSHPIVGVLIFIALALIGSYFFIKNSPRNVSLLPGQCSADFTQGHLADSLKLGIKFLLNNQRLQGNFHYEYDWQERTYSPEDSQVRQAGALWGLITAYAFTENPQLLLAAKKGFAFFESLADLNAGGGLFISYPGSPSGRTGTVALLGLAYMDYYRHARNKLSKEEAIKFIQKIEQIVAFLLQAQMEDKRWHAYYDRESGEPFGLPSSYFDGQALLALVKGAKILGRQDLTSLAVEAAERGYDKNIVRALKVDADSKITKGYYQWATMAFYELALTGWESRLDFGKIGMEFGNWMTDVHKTLTRNRNTSYAHEGLLHSFELAKVAGDESLAQKFLCVLEKGMTKMSSWQIGNPLMLKSLSQFATNDPNALGGIQNHAQESGLRIDIAQHQMHAVILALRFIFEKSSLSIEL